MGGGGGGEHLNGIRCEFWLILCGITVNIFVETKKTFFLLFIHSFFLSLLKVALILLYLLLWYLLKLKLKISDEDSSLRRCANF